MPSWVPHFSPSFLTFIDPNIHLSSLTCAHSNSWNVTQTVNTLYKGSARGREGRIVASSSDSCCLPSPELYWPLSASLWCKGTEILLFPATLWYFWCNYLLIYSLLDFPLNVLQHFKIFIQCFQISMLSKLCEHISSIILHKAIKYQS